MPIALKGRLYKVTDKSIIYSKFDPSPDFCTHWKRTTYSLSNQEMPNQEVLLLYGAWEGSMHVSPRVLKYLIVCLVLSKIFSFCSYDGVD